MVFFACCASSCVSRALNNRDFGTWMANVIRNLSQDMNMENRMCILPRMSGRSGWLQHFRVGSPLYDDDGELFAALVRSISVVEGHQSEVLATLAGLLDSCLHVARNGCYSALEVSAVIFSLFSHRHCLFLSVTL